MFAEISTVDQWMIGFTGLMALATFGALVVMIVALNKKQQVRVETPLDVQTVESFVSKAEFNQFVAAATSDIHQIREILRQEIPALERRISESGEHRVTKLHDRINQVLAEVSRLEGIVEQALVRGRTGH
jgi:hypothetical protein